VSTLDQNIDTKHFGIANRRYIGNKNKLMPWISELIRDNTQGTSFFDVFAGTGSVTEWELPDFDTFHINDFLYSNEIVFKAFFGNEEYNPEKLDKLAAEYNQINERRDDDDYFVTQYGDKFFSHNDAIKIGEIRERIQRDTSLNDRERSILLASLVYSADRAANTVGHYDAYRKLSDVPDRFVFGLITPEQTTGKDINIYRRDANELVREINADVVFLDPPYNSRQYSRFYHVLEAIVKWDKPQLFGVAMKPKAENMSDYSKTSAPKAFDDLIQNIHGRYIVVTYNNTYENAKSSSSRNKITHEQILNSLNAVGKTQVFDQNYKSFNAGNTDLGDHKEFVFITEVTQHG
jgi:adenine-specific DNA-methyltransferase